MSGVDGIGGVSGQTSGVQQVIEFAKKEGIQPADLTQAAATIQQIQGVGENLNKVA